MKTIALLALFLPAFVGCQSLPHPAPGLSAVRVKVIAEPKAGVVGPRSSTYDQSSGTGYGDFERVDYSDLHDIVVWLEPEDAKMPIPASAPRVIDLDGRTSIHATFFAHVAGAGQKLIFRNSGLEPLSAYSVSDGNEFNLGTIEPNGTAEIVLKSAGVVELLSDTRADPLVRICVAPSPWIVQAPRSGESVDFNNLPPGHYKIVSWHPRLPGSTSEVTLLPDQVAQSSVTVSVNPLPKIGSK